MTAQLLKKTLPSLNDLLGNGQKWPRRQKTRAQLAEEPIEPWELAASDALRAEILSSYIPVSEEELARIFKQDDDKREGPFESVETETIPLLREAIDRPAVAEGRRAVPTAKQAETKAPAPEPAAAEIEAGSLGVFSDSRIYAAMIHHELKGYDIKLRHFRHPASFQPERFTRFDRIAAWMIFLSDDHDSDFLDRFLDRYGDRPTLFLFENSQRRRTSSNIARFLEENSLTGTKTSSL